jgi:hypothetical protein
MREEIIPRAVCGTEHEIEGQKYVADAVIDVDEDGNLVFLSGLRLPIEDTAIGYAKENLDTLLGPCWRAVHEA